MKEDDLCPRCKEGKLIPYPVSIELLEWEINFPGQTALECSKCDCLFPAEKTIHRKRTPSGRKILSKEELYNLKLPYPPEP